MVKFTSKSEVTQACMNSIYYNLRNKISDRKYAKVVQTVNSGFKDGSMESIWKSFKKHKRHINGNEFLQLKNDVEEFLYPECTICCAKKCTENHCTTCKGRDKMVCRGCILKMTKLDEDLNLCYKCPYCGTKGIRQNWFNTDVSALTKTNDLLRKKLQGNSIVESLFSDSDSDSDESE